MHTKLDGSARFVVAAELRCSDATPCQVRIFTAVRIKTIAVLFMLEFLSFESASDPSQESKVNILFLLWEIR